MQEALREMPPLALSLHTRTETLPAFGSEVANEFEGHSYIRCTTEGTLVPLPPPSL